MLRFFRNIRQRLLTENKFSKYLLYAVGEILLVVIGILIALQIDTWNQELQNNKKEQEYYHKFLEDVLLDEEIIKQEISATETRLNASISLVSLLLNDEPDQMLISQKLQSSVANSTIALKPTTNGYDDLKSSGSLNIIRDDALKFELDQFYSDQTQIMKVIETNGQLLLNRLMDGEDIMKTSFGILFLENVSDTTNLNRERLIRLIEPTLESNYDFLNDAIVFTNVSRRNLLHLNNLLDKCAEIEKRLRDKIRSYE